MHELCYATSKNPRDGFVYGGVLVSNCDMHIDTYKPANMRIAPSGNNHGSIVEINNQWYVFYHRQTNGSWFSRQGCAERIYVNTDGSINQAEITSCGLNNGPLDGKGEYPAYLACHMFNPDGSNPKITQDGKDGDEVYGHIADIRDGAIIGYKYFKFDGTEKEISIKTRCYFSGEFQVMTSWDGEPLATIKAYGTNIWWEFSSPISLPAGVYPLYFKYVGGGNPHFWGFEIK